MKIGMLLLNDDPFTTVDFAITHNFDIVEIAMENWIDSIDESDVKKLHGLCQKNNLMMAVHAPSRDLNLSSYNNGIRAESIRQIKKCIHIFGGMAKHLTIHTGYIPKYRELGTLERTIKAINILLNESRIHCLNICIENIYENNIDFLMDYIKLSDSQHVKLTLDIAHLKLYGSCHPSLAIRALAPFIENIHLSDNNGIHDQHLPLGTGTIDFIKIIKALNKIDYKKSLIIEALDMNDALISRAYLSQLINVI